MYEPVTRILDRDEPSGNSGVTSRFIYSRLSRCGEPHQFGSSTTMGNLKGMLRESKKRSRILSRTGTQMVELGKQEAAQLCAQRRFPRHFRRSAPFRRSRRDHHRTVAFIGKTTVIASGCILRRYSTHNERRDKGLARPRVCCKGRSTLPPAPEAHSRGSIRGRDDSFPSRRTSCKNSNRWPARSRSNTYNITTNEEC